MKHLRTIAVGVLVAIMAMEILRPLWTWLGWWESWLVAVAVVFALEFSPALLRQRGKV